MVTNQHSENIVRQMLDEARADVVQADQKASILLGIVGVAFSVVLGGQIAGDFDANDLTPLGECLWWIAVGAIVLSVTASGMAIWPRYQVSDPDEGITYWGHVAAYRDPDRLDGALELQIQSTRRRNLHQLSHVSRLVRTKYVLVRWALVLGGLAAGLFTLATQVFH